MASKRKTPEELAEELLEQLETCHGNMVIVRPNRHKEHIKYSRKRVQQLLDAGADLEYIGHNGTPLTVAIINGIKDVAVELINRGTGLLTKFGNGYSPLTAAAKWGTPAIIDSYMKAAEKQNIDLMPYMDEALSKASVEDNVHAVKRFLKYMKKHPPDDKGSLVKAFMKATRHGSPKTVKELLSYGAAEYISYKNLQKDLQRIRQRYRTSALSKEARNKMIIDLVTPYLQEKRAEKRKTQNLLKKGMPLTRILIGVKPLTFKKPVKNP